MMNEAKLNWREHNKQELTPYAYLENIDTLYFDLLNDNDRFYLQDAGIYNHESEDESFMLRLRLNAGRISPQQLTLIAKIVQEHDLDIILTVRAQMQLHGLDVDNVLAVWRELNDNGVSTWQTLGDNVRNIVTDVFDGVGHYSEIEVYPYIKQMQSHILKQPKHVGLLPRRISIGISGNRANLNAFFANDLFFALAQKDDIKGFNVYLGGKNSEVAQDANVFLQPQQVVAYFKAVIEAFNLHGSRATRGKTRLFHWLKQTGMHTVKQCIDAQHDLTYETAGSLLLEKYDRTLPHRLKDGSSVYIHNTDAGRVDADTFVKLAQLAQEHKAEVRLGVDQQIYLLGLSSAMTSTQRQATNTTISTCAGSQHCIFSFWNVKEDVTYLPHALIDRHKIMVGFSGCTKGCAKHQHADIGLLSMVTSSYGPHQKTARVYLGGEYTLGQQIARPLNISIPQEALNSFLELIIREYEHSGLETFEHFSQAILNSYSADFLALWFLAKKSTDKTLFLQKNVKAFEERCTQHEREMLHSNFSDLIPSGEFNALSEITRLSKMLWVESL